MLINSRDSFHRLTYAKHSRIAGGFGTVRDHMTAVQCEFRDAYEAGFPRIFLSVPEANIPLNGGTVLNGSICGFEDVLVIDQLFYPAPTPDTFPNFLGRRPRENFNRHAGRRVDSIQASVRLTQEGTAVGCPDGAIKVAPLVRADGFDIRCFESPLNTVRNGP